MDRSSSPSTSQCVKRGAMIALVVAIAACGSDSTNSPDNTVSGRWSYSATDLHGIVSFSCSILDATMSLTQSGTTVTGSVSGGTLSCLGSGGLTNEALSGGVITNGVINGSTVQLEFGDTAHSKRRDCVGQLDVGQGCT